MSLKTNIVYLGKVYFDLVRFNEKAAKIIVGSHNSIKEAIATNDEQSLDMLRKAKADLMDEYLKLGRLIDTLDGR